MPSPAQSAAARTLIFGPKVQPGHPYILSAHCGQRSKVKVKNPQKYAFSGPILVTGAMCGAIEDQGWSGGVPLEACQLMLASCQKLGNNGGPSPDRFRSIGKLPV